MPQYRLGEGAHGSAYQGTITDIVGAGDLQAIEVGERTFGLFLGHFDWVQTYRHTWYGPASGLWAWIWDQRLEYRFDETIPQVQDIRFTGDQHHLIVASIGSGKFRDVLSNMLLHDGSCETACLAIDPKAEIASVIGPYIDAEGTDDPRTILLDPWNITGAGRTESSTLLAGIRADNSHCVKDARVLADAIILERSSDDGHWVATTKAFLVIILLYLCLDPEEEGHRTLFRLRQIVTMPWKTHDPTDEEARAGIEKKADLQVFLKYLAQSDLMEGVVRRGAQAMLNRQERERLNILSTLDRDTAFIEDPKLWPAIETDSFDFNELVLSNKRLHVIVPFDYTKDMSSWLRLTIAAFYNACLRHQLPDWLPKYLRFRHVIIDEFAGLGKLDFLFKDIAEARGIGVKYHLAIQNFPQLRDLYKEGWESFVSCSFIHAFGITDNFTAKYLSEMTGQATVVTETKGFSESVTDGVSKTVGSSRSSTVGRSHAGLQTTYTSSETSGSSEATTASQSITKGTTTTFSTTGRPVLMPDEIRRLSDQQQLLFIRGQPVLMTRRTPYFETFRRFEPDHSLRDILGGARLPTRRALVPFSKTNIKAPGPLSAVNSFLRLPAFTPPAYVRHSLLRALFETPAFVVGLFCLLCLSAGYAYFRTTPDVPGAPSGPTAQERAAAILQAAPGQLSQGGESGLFVSQALAGDITTDHPSFLVGALAQGFDGTPACDPEHVIIKGFSAICRWSGGLLLVNSNTMPTSPIHKPASSFSENGIPLGRDGLPLSVPSGGDWEHNRVYIRFEEQGSRYEQLSGRIIASLTAATPATAARVHWVPAKAGLGFRSCYVFKGRTSLDITCYEGS